MCPDGSDYRYAEDVRVRNKIVRETRKKALLFKNDDIDLTDIQGELEARAKFIATPLDRMVKNKEISSYEIIVKEGTRRRSWRTRPCGSKSATSPGATSARWRSTWAAPRSLRDRREDKRL